MPPLIATLFGGAWSLIQRVLKAAVSYPWQAALVIALAACGWLYMGKQSALATIAKRDETITQMEATSKIATAAQMALFNEVTSKQTQIAEKSDDAYKYAQSIAGAATTRYIDRWRVQPNSCGREADSATENGNSEVPDTMSARTILVSERDVQACTGATAYAIEAHNHAVNQVEAGLAVPVE